MPTAKTIYESFDGREFSSEEDASTWERNVIKSGIECRNDFINFLKEQDEEIASMAKKNFIEYLQSISDEDA